MSPYWSLARPRDLHHYIVNDLPGSLWALASDPVQILHGEINAMLAQPETAKRLSQDGAEPMALSRQAFAKLISTDVEKWTKLAKAANIKAE